MTLTGTEIDIDLIHEIEGAIPCEIDFLHGTEMQPQDEPAMFILTVSGQCQPDCPVPLWIEPVTVLICQPCLAVAVAMGWRVLVTYNGATHPFRYVPLRVEPINKAGS